MLGYERKSSEPVSIGVTEVYRLIEEIKKRNLISGTIHLHNGVETGFGAATYAKFPNEDKLVEITDYAMW